MRLDPLLSLLLFSVLLLSSSLAGAAVVTPTKDDEVIEVLPAVSGGRAEERRLRQQLVSNPKALRPALALARRYLEQAREQGDPRYAGRALAVLQAWPAAADAPDDVLLLQATLQQYLHDFEGAAVMLQQLVARNPSHAQAWLTLATVRRVQGRYADSDVACEGLATTGSSLYAQACKAENDSLRGNFKGAEQAIRSLLAMPEQSAATKNWLLTTLAESEARAGRPEQADAAYRAAQAAQPDGYTAMSYADFLLLRSRPGEALAQLQSQARSDPVLLRLAIAGLQAGAPQARRDLEELQARMKLAALRPDVRLTHARELSMFALAIDKAPRDALALARENVRHQREPLDLLLLAQAAVANKDAAALEEAAQLRTSMGLHDKRLDALLNR